MRHQDITDVESPDAVALEAGQLVLVSVLKQLGQETEVENIRAMAERKIGPSISVDEI